MISDKPVGEPAYDYMYERSVAEVSLILKKEKQFVFIQTAVISKFIRQFLFLFWGSCIYSLQNFLCMHFRFWLQKNMLYNPSFIYNKCGTQYTHVLSAI
jgi:hypothetical protein